MPTQSFGYAVSIISFFIAILAFFITLKVSDFFIAPSDRWRKSRYAIFMMKLGMAGGVALWIFFITATFLSGAKS
jgi:hypothetical protein